MARRRRSTRKGMRRRTARRAYIPKRRRRRSTTKRRKSSRSPRATLGSKIYTLAKGVAPFLAFGNQITAKDYEVLNQQANYKNENIATKAKIFTNIVAGRMTGITPFKNGNLYGSETTPFTINPNGLINKWTGLGVAGLIYKNLPIKQLPQKSKVGTIAKGLLLGGGVGGLFDAPESMSIGSPSMTSSPQVLGRNMTVIQQNRKVTQETGRFSPSNDPIGSGFVN